jgi:hypothetical protein
VPFPISATNPAPAPSALSPSNAQAGGAAFTLTVTGSNFVSSSGVRWNGAARTTTFVSATKLQASISASDIAAAGTASVTVVTPAPGGGTSAPLTFTINVNATNPAPALAGLSPSSTQAAGASLLSVAAASSSGLTITVLGSNFVTSSVVRWNGADRATTFTSGTRLVATIPASDVATVGTATVTVFTPAPGGGTSNGLPFTVTAPGGADIIIDNQGAGTRSTGRWCVSAAPNAYGTNSLYSCGGGRDIYRWTPTVPAAGAYDVHVWWTSLPSRSSSVPITVAHAKGKATKYFDQRNGGGRWVFHGRYTFTAATAGYVETSDSRGQVSADAIRLVPAGGATVQQQPSASGLVAAYAFKDGSGTAVVDSSGNNNTGAVTNAAWTSQGRFGSALYFNGSGFVTVPDAASLDFTSGMTLEAWVYPTATPANWSTAIIKEQPGEFVYALYAGSPTNRPNVYFNVSTSPSGERGFAGPSALPLNTWTHLAGTYDGATLSLYVNGVLVGSHAVAGPIATSTGVLRIGGNTVWGEYFTGRIDEVRLYNRALSQSEIQTDMNTPLQ